MHLIRPPQMPRHHHLARVLLPAALLVGCAAPAPDTLDPTKPHHTSKGFRNADGVVVEKPPSQLLKWRFAALRDGLPPDPKERTPVVAPELEALGRNTVPGKPSATWLGHASVLVQSGGLNILTDPVFSERASPVQFAGPKRAQPPGIALAALPPIDLVLISHSHYDHLDRDSVVQLAQRGGQRTLFLVPLGLKQWMAGQGITNVVELDWWDTYSVRGVPVQLVPVQHWSARGLGDRNETLWGGWVVRAPDLHWYFSGDTGYAAHFKQTRERGGAVDLALLAIGAYEPRWFMREQHMDPTEAVQAHKDLGARHSIGIHWGTFALTDEPLDQPPRDLAKARDAAGLAAQDFTVLAIGQTRWLPAREARQSSP
jgi:N-acyl-phosphatidylethanolamine-hydrolysing phospholipase D